MISHVTIAIHDLERARAFYGPLMVRLGYEESWHVEGQECAFRAPGHDRPLFFLCKPWQGEPDPGNGPMVGFLAPDRDAVRAVHAMALAAGGQEEGAPGLRERYHPHYFAGYFRDPDGNKICVVCHQG